MLSSAFRSLTFSLPGARCRTPRGLAPLLLSSALLWSGGALAQGATSPAAVAAPAPGAAGGAAGIPAPPPAEATSNFTNVTEADNRTYLFVGLRYRGLVLPKFLLNAFIDGGQTVYSNNIGVELDIRKNGFSIIPALTYSEFDTGYILFKDKKASEFVGNYSLVNSSLKAIHATVDLLWSAKIAPTLDFEYGLGLGLGVVFDTLLNNWVREDSNGLYASDTGKKYSPCVAEETQVTGTGCSKKDHQNAANAKVNNYLEPSWANGGSKPNILPWIAPQIGLRFKPIKQFESRLGLGISATGFWFGLSGNYGLERPVQKGPEVVGLR